jgi:putative ABC transport system substrate-binding protein
LEEWDGRRLVNVIPPYRAANEITGFRRSDATPVVRHLGGLAALVLVVSVLPAGAQPVGKVPRIGFVGLPNESTESRWQDGFARGLRELGHVPGRTIVVDARTYTTHDQLHKVLSEFVLQRVDVIVVGPPFAALAARQATRQIPIVCGSCGDPTENGLAVSLARPGGNVTGLASLSAELIGKRLELMKELLPGVSRLAVFVFPANPGTRATLRVLDTSGRALGLDIERVEIRNASDFESAFRSAARGGVRGVVLQDDPLLRTVGAQIAELALKHRLPVSTGLSELAESGALMAYGPDRVDLYRRAAGFVDKILKGAKPGELPFEQATKFSLVLNLQTAKALGVTIPQSFLLRAERLIE